MGRSAASLDAGSLEKEKGILKNDAIDVIQAHGKNDNDTGWQEDSGNQGVGAPHIRDRAYWVADTESARPSHRGSGPVLAVAAKSSGIHVVGLANTLMQQRPHGKPGISAVDDEGGRIESAAAATGLCSDLRPGPTNGHWKDADWLYCRDGKWRPVEPGTSPLVNGAPSRVGRLRGYGNAINAKVAQAFIESVMDIA